MYNVKKHWGETVWFLLPWLHYDVEFDIYTPCRLCTESILAQIWPLWVERNQSYLLNESKFQGKLYPLIIWLSLPEFFLYKMKLDKLISAAHSFSIKMRKIWHQNIHVVHLLIFIPYIHFDTHTYWVNSMDSLKQCITMDS